jgi:hypothetical protein
MKTSTTLDQPRPVTPGLTRAMVRQHAYEMFRDKLRSRPLTIEDWILAEKDLVEAIQREEVTSA